MAVDANGNPIDPNAPSATGGSGLGDLLAGIAGAPVNRPALGAGIANGQSLAGLRTAQTEEAMTKAMQAREQMAAKAQLEDSITQMKGPDGNPMFQPSQAHFLAQGFNSGGGNIEQMVAALKGGNQVSAQNVLGNPANLGTPAATAAGQLYEGKPAAPMQTIPEQGVPTPGVPQQPTVVSPLAQSQIAERGALANAAQHRADQPFTQGIGGFQVSPELQQAVNEGRLDPSRLNSRTVQIFDQMARSNPTMDFNSAISSAALQRNAALRRSTAVMEALPANIQNMVSLGSKLNYPDEKFGGIAEQWLQGQMNDPALSEYMGVRNDTLMNLASVMRGVGMSDQAHRAEIEAAAPTMSPAALQGWAKGQIAVIQRRQEQYQEMLHPRNVGGASVAPAPATAAAPAAGPGQDLQSLAKAELARRVAAQQPPVPQAPGAQ